MKKIQLKLNQLKCISEPTARKCRDGILQGGRKYMMPLILALGFTFFIAFPAQADIRLPGIISEHMVIQQNMPVRLWGWADDGEVVKATLEGNTATATATAGKWDLTLSPMKAGGPYTLTFQGKNMITFKDVLVGEVWVSCGQSNMMMNLSAVEGGPQAIAENSKYPHIRVVNIPGGASEQPQDDVKCAWTSELGGFSAVSYFFGRALNEHLKVPVGLINAVAIMPGEAWIDQDTLMSVPAMREMPKRAYPKPVTTFNSMIAPLTRYAIRGAIYYQGEYNTGRYIEYRKVLPALIASWRSKWGLGDFPFLFVQLPGYYEHKAETDKKMDMPPQVLNAMHAAGGVSEWAGLREAQSLTWRTTPNTGMVVTIDLGDPQDIHPRKKKPVGERLSLAARALAYKEAVDYSGPVFDSFSAVEDGKLIVRFKSLGGGLISKNDELKGFEIAGADQKYVWAKAEIAGDTVRLSSPEVKDPVFVRYGWANFPNCSLFGKNGLPASPFRAFAQGKVRQCDRISIPFRNPGFETPGKEPVPVADWIQTGNVVRTDEKASEGRWSVKLANGDDNKSSSIAQAEIVAMGIYRYDWNSDLLEPVAFRPGMVAGYSLDMAGDGRGKRGVYLRLCGDPTAGGSRYWGMYSEGTKPFASTSSDKFVTRRIANQMTCLDGNAMGVGTLFVNSSEEGKFAPGVLYLDNLSEIQVIRPKLSVSDASPIDMGTVAVNETAESSVRFITNSQAETLPDQRNDNDPVRQVVTLLHGVCNLKTSLQNTFEHVFGETDEVGAVIIGRDAALFEFVSAHRGATAQELKLIGEDDKGGLLGGTSPEREALTLKFIGSSRSGTFEACIRIVTQAGNCGQLSTGKTGEPLENNFYLDIPVIIKVREALK